ncbi:MULTISPECIES: hypothetical protein [unclassified Pseudofrankia]|nr:MULTISPECIES: hypothetical protein [unclassified Pseudofrankia]MDT3441969.1 hypothetical protein [Pseudofrankia sp. BMG5.37]
MKKLLALLVVGAAAAYALPRLLARSNTQVHRINQNRAAPGASTHG